MTDGYVYAYDRLILIFRFQDYHGILSVKSCLKARLMTLGLHRT